MSRRYINLVIIFVILVVAIYIDSGSIIPFTDQGFPTILGLDLRGGTQALLEVDLPADASVTSSQMNDARTILNNRINGLGVAEAVTYVAGTRRMVVEIPGLTDPTQVINVIKSTGQLEFVDMKDTRLNVGTEIKTDLGTSSSGGAITATPGIAVTPTMAATSTLAPTAGPGTPTATASPTPAQIWHTVMTGDQLSSVTVTTDQLGKPQIAFSLKSDGAKVFSDYTGANVGKILAIVLDKKIISAPSINSQIPSGEGVIQGSFTQDEANALAVQMRYGSLPIPLKVIESKIIGPSLGKDSLDRSLLAGMIGFAIVALFMIIYYRLPGFLAILSILVYAAMTFAIFKLIHGTLTLPGIVGFMLSTGSALDANILIFERMKEELRNGKSLTNAIELGWRRAWPSIRDSNLATLITCVILIIFGTQLGATIVLGFAITLLIGLLVSIFCAIFVTRTFIGMTLDFFRTVSERLGWFGI